MSPFGNFVLDNSCVQTIAGASTYRPTAGWNSRASMIMGLYRAGANSVSSQLEPAKSELGKETLESCAIIRMVEPDQAQGLDCRLDNYNNEIRAFLRDVIDEARKNHRAISANANVVSSTQATLTEGAQQFVRPLERWNHAGSNYFMLFTLVLLACLFLCNALSSVADNEPLHQDQSARLKSEETDSESLITIKIEEEEVIQLLTFGPYPRPVIKVEDSD
ncbi:hypothetical protein C0993_011158 [Termitomyces sp. T159_Od127]|nr:hypothetical protein C0993_011158 [Termitomyces sp. T159_Od127]